MRGAVPRLADRVRRGRLRSRLKLLVCGMRTMHDLSQATPLADAGVQAGVSSSYTSFLKSVQM